MMLKILLLAVMAATIAGPAHADPISAIAGFFMSVAPGMGLATATALAQMAFGIGGNLLATAIATATMDKPKINVQFDVDFGDDTPLSFIVGDYATAGKMKYVGSWGKNTRWVTQVVEISCLPVAGLQNVWVNDEIADIRWTQPRSENGQLMGYPIKNFSEGVGTSDERDRAWIKFVDGTQTTADPFLTATFGSDADYPWTSAMIGRGKAYAILTVYYDPEVMTASPGLLFQPEPLPVYDPRKDSTAGGSGSHRWGNRATYEASRNPAVIAYNIARGIYWNGEWLFGGKNLPAWRLPTAEWFAAMNACDASVAISGGGTERAFRAGLQITVDMTAADVLEELGRAANMRFAEVGGRLKPIVNLPGAAAFAFTDDSILITEGQSYKPFNGLGETFNALSATYPEPSEKWASKDAPEYIDAAATEADGGRYLPTSLSYPAAPYRRQVQRLMRAQMRDYRRMRLHQFYLPPEAYVLEPLVDMVSWTSNRNGYENKLFVVEQVDPTPGMNVMVTLREVDPSDYDWSSSFEKPTTIVPPAPVRPWVQVIAGFGVEAVTLTDNATRARSAAIRVFCDGDEVGVTGIRIQIRKASAADAEVDVVRPWREPYQWYVQTVQQRTTYQVRAQLQSRLTRRTAWTGWLTVTTDAIYVSDDDFVDGVTGLFESAGIKPTRDIADRSVPGNYVGELAWSRADSRLYRWNGTEWIHFIQESVAGILDETAFVQSIRVPKISATLPTTGNRVGDMIYRTTDGIIYRWTGTAWTAEVSATQIVGKLVAGQIAVGAVGTEQLAAKAATMSKLLVADLSNMVGNNWTGGDFDGWSTNGDVTIENRTDSVFVSGGIAGNMAVFRGAEAWLRSPISTVSKGDEYYCELYVRRSSGTVPDGNALVQVRWTLNDGSAAYSTVGVVSTLATVQVSNIVIAPDNAVDASIWIRPNVSGTVGAVFLARPTLRRANSGKLVVDGTLQARHIEFETLTGGLMAPTGIITKSAQIENALIGNAHIKNAAVDRLKIGDNELYVPYQYTRSDFEVTSAYYQANKVTFVNHNITGFEGGAFTVTFNADMDARLVDDAFGGFDLLVGGSLVQRSNYGVNAGGGGGAKANFIMPVVMSAGSYGSSSVNIQVRAWTFKWDDVPSPKANFWVRNISLTVSGSRR